jgi:hypothetical protein
MMFVSPRCNCAGPLGKSIPTRSFGALVLSFLPARLPGRAIARLRW